MIVTGVAFRNLSYPSGVHYLMIEGDYSQYDLYVIEWYGKPNCEISKLILDEDCSLISNRIDENTFNSLKRQINVFFVEKSESV